MKKAEMFFKTLRYICQTSIIAQAFMAIIGTGSSVYRSLKMNVNNRGLLKLEMITKSVFIVIAILLLILGGGMFRDANAAISPTERAALIALYNSTDGDNWTDNSGWKTPPLDVDGFAMPGTENTWYGITCDVGNTTVLRVELNNINMQGTIPSALGDLTGLEQLQLDNNFNLTGSIPSELGNLINLQDLMLNTCGLTGTIPSELGNLINLGYIGIGGNNLTGSIPTELGNLSSLYYLYLY